MTKPYCPHCGHSLPRLKARWTEDEAVSRVLRAAYKITSIQRLATVYIMGSNIHERSARRAVERLAKAGYLVRVRPGYYRRAPGRDLDW